MQVWQVSRKCTYAIHMQTLIHCTHLIFVPVQDSTSELWNAFEKNLSDNNATYSGSGKSRCTFCLARHRKSPWNRHKKPQCFIQCSWMWHPFLAIHHRVSHNYLERNVASLPMQVSESHCAETGIMVCASARLVLAGVKHSLNWYATHPWIYNRMLLTSRA